MDNLAVKMKTEDEELVLVPEEPKQGKRNSHPRAEFPLPPWIPRPIWEAFEEMRKKIKAPLTDQARKNIVSSLERMRAEGQNAEAVLNQSIERAYRGVFPVKGGNGQTNGHAPEPKPNGTVYPTAAERRAAKLDAFMAKED